jgi:hypothetical protein
MKKQILLPIFLLSFIFVDAQTSFTVCDSITPANMTGSGYVANCLTTTDTCCVYHLSLPIPSWANITDIRNTTSYWAVGPNTMMNGSCRVSYSGCTASLLSCPMPTWGACVREREFMLPDISPCIPPIQCDGYAMDFELHLCRCVGAPFGCSSAEITSFQSWIVCISGTTTICTGVGEINIGNWKITPTPQMIKLFLNHLFSIKKTAPLFYMMCSGE